MKTANLKLLSLLLILLAVGCGRNNSSAPETASAEYQALNEEVKNEAIDTTRKLIKEGRVEFETEDIQATRQQIFNSIDRYRGYMSSDRESKSPGRVSNTIIVRVPADRFDAFLNDATKGVDKFDSKEIEVKDVTEEYLDISARLKTKKELEKRYLQLLEKTESVSEILQIEKQIGELRADIESIEGRLKYLENKISLSTLTLTFYKNTPGKSDFSNKFRKGFRNGWDNLIWFFVFLTNIWPFILIALGLIIGFRIWRKRGR